MSDVGRKEWFAVDVTADPTAVEAVEHAFNMLDCRGIEIDDFRKDRTSDLCVVGYFDDFPDVDGLTATMFEALAIHDLPSEAIRTIARRTVVETDWLAEWKKHWRPTEVGPFVIAPPWSDVPDTGKIVIRIEPNMAFGTGTHETTQLCLSAIGEHLRDGQSFLDVGTGTGILAIAAAKLAPSSTITACETDIDAIKIARENATANGVAERIDFFEGSLTEDTPHHDLVCANLTLDVIVPLLPSLLDKASEKLLLSGILAEQADAVRAELLKFEISNLKLQFAGEWLAVLIRK